MGVFVWVYLHVCVWVYIWFYEIEVDQVSCIRSTFISVSVLCVLWVTVSLCEQENEKDRAREWKRQIKIATEKESKRDRASVWERDSKERKCEKDTARERERWEWERHISRERDKLDDQKVSKESENRHLDEKFFFSSFFILKKYFFPIDPNFFRLRPKPIFLERKSSAADPINFHALVNYMIKN